MNPHDVDPPRWRGRASDHHDREDRAARLLDAAAEVRPRVSVTLPRIEAALASRRPTLSRAPLPVLAMTAVIACPVLALGSMALSRGWIGARPPARTRLATVVRPAGDTASPHIPVAAPPEPEPPPVSPPDEVPGPRVSPPSPRRPASAAREEISALRAALQQLRRARDPLSALRLLDKYDRRFPRGLLRQEALVTRVEALLAVGRSDDAWRALEALPDAVVTRSRPLLIARGELRAARGRCGEALVDFLLVASSGDGDEIDRRAERGRAVCRAPQPAPRQP
jgi:hypothetical protein